MEPDDIDEKYRIPHRASQKEYRCYHLPTPCRCPSLFGILAFIL